MYLLAQWETGTSVNLRLGFVEAFWTVDWGAVVSVRAAIAVVPKVRLAVSKTIAAFVAFFFKVVVLLSVCLS
jgi:hypothetical protein